MSNYTKQNLVPVSPSQAPAGTLALKVGDVVFTAGSVSSGGSSDSSSGTMDDLEFFDWMTILNNN